MDSNRTIIGQIDLCVVLFENVNFLGTRREFWHRFLKSEGLIVVLTSTKDGYILYKHAKNRKCQLFGHTARILAQIFEILIFNILISPCSISTSFQYTQLGTSVDLRPSASGQPRSSQGSTRNKFGVWRDPDYLCKIPCQIELVYSRVSRFLRKLSGAVGRNTIAAYGYQDTLYQI